MLSLKRRYSFLITKELIFGFQILDLKDHFSASLTALNRPIIPRLILKHWVPSWVENGIKWVNRKIGVHLGRNIFMKVRSINFEPPDIVYLCSACHVYPFFSWSMDHFNTIYIEQIDLGVDFIIWWITKNLWPSELKRFSCCCQWSPI